jgi:DNA-binding NarL/FixJ family response regulator
MNTAVLAQRTCPIATLLVDDCAEFRLGLRNLLNFYNTTSSFNFQIIGQAANLNNAVEIAIEQCPQLILLDMELSQGSGIEVLQQLKMRSKLSHVLVLSGHQEAEWIFKAMQAGAQGYVFKQQLSTQLMEAIQVILNHQIYLSPEAATSFFQHFHFATGRSTGCNASIHLTDRERDVLYWLVQGASNEVIAQQLYITVGTVKAYLTTIFEKLNVTSRTQAALQALKLGLISV